MTETTSNPDGARIAVPRSESPRVSIIVARAETVWSRPDQDSSAAEPRPLLACLRSLGRHLPASIPSETIVVLDGAPSGAAGRLQTSVSGVRTVVSSVRIGLARAGNQGRRVAGGEFLVLLHDDAVIEAGWLEALVAAADAHPEAGVVGSLVLFPDGVLQGAGMILFRDGTISPPWAGPPPSPVVFGRMRAVDFCGSCSLLVRAETWDAVGGLDERFYPTCYVDADLGMAARNAGWVVLFQPASRIRLHRGSSLRPRFRAFVSGRYRAAFVAKWTRALEDHEPRTDEFVRTIPRALARAEALAARLAASPAPERPHVERPRARELDPAEERRCLEQDLELYREYAKGLEAALEAAPETQAIQRLLWWRLYVRLLPVLRWLRRPGATWLSHRGATSRTG